GAKLEGRHFVRGKWCYGASQLGPSLVRWVPEDQTGLDRRAKRADAPGSADQQRVRLPAIRNYVYLNGARRREAGPMDWLIEERREGLSEGREARHRPGALRRPAG